MDEMRTVLGVVALVLAVFALASSRRSAKRGWATVEKLRKEQLEEGLKPLFALDGCYVIGSGLEEARKQAVDAVLDEIEDEVDACQSEYVRLKLRQYARMVEDGLRITFDKGVEWAKENQ